MPDVFDDLTRAISQPDTDWRTWWTAVAVDLAGKLIAGVAIGVGIAAGLALAG